MSPHCRPSDFRQEELGLYEYDCTVATVAADFKHRRWQLLEWNKFLTMARYCTRTKYTDNEQYSYGVSYE
eukprot:scaffold458738_cov17-Prasinocladus_malaysianus.AAC.1